MPKTRSMKKRPASSAPAAVEPPPKKARHNGHRTAAPQLLDTTARTSSADRVLQTYELLEQILVKLPLKDLFVLQRVSTTWRGLIGRSVEIRKRMFLLADGMPLEERKNDEASFTGRIRLNPICDAQCDERRHQTRDCDCERRGHDDSECDHWPCPHYDCTTSLGCAHLEDNSPLLYPTTTDLLVVVSSAPDESATSARDTFLTQPPITAIQFWAAIKSIPMTTIHESGGIKLGNLMDNFAGALAAHKAECNRQHEDDRSCAQGMRRDWTDWMFSIQDHTMAVESNPDGDQEPKICHICRFKDVITAE